MHYERLKAPARILLTTLAAASASSAFGQSILMAPRPVYDGLSPGQGVVPVEVDLANLGPDARGVVKVSVGDFSMNYPVELPQGARKRLITYPDSGDYGGGPVQFDLFTNRGHLQQMLEPRGSGQFEVYGEVAESSGDLEFIRAEGPKKQGDYGYSVMPQLAYVKPADAPDRPVGYQRLSALVLGDGAERLSDDSVRAIQAWVLQGGSLVFIGGASSPVLNDVRWSTLLPVRNASPKNFEGSQSLAARYGSSPGKFTAMVGDPVPQASSRAGGLILERPVGLGRAVYIAFDPFSNPMDTWSSRTKLFDEVLNPALLAGPRMAIATIVDSGIRDYMSGYAYGSPYPSYRGRSRYSTYPGDTVTNNPFQAQLPQTSRVLGILFIYFLAVVPVNFLVLRKLKKGELAWVTAPILSLAFAGVFFESARGLYGAKMSTSTSGILIAQAGQKDSIVIGHSQLFFPAGGRYDLRLSSVDSLTSGANPYDYRGRSHSVYEDIDPMDNGQIQTSINVPSLAFREFTYRARMEAGDWMEVHRLANGHFQVTNKSPYKLVDARLAGGGGWVLAGDLAPNESKEIAFAKLGTSDDFPGRLGRLLTRSRGLAVTGRLQGLRPGPQIGTEVNGSDGLTLSYVTNELLKDSEIRQDLAKQEGPD